MSNVGNSKRRIARKVTVATALALAAMLAACGGGNGSSDDTSSASNASVTPPVSPDTAASDTPATSTSFFDSVFLDGVGAGYYQFDSNGPLLHPTATGQLRIYVTADAKTNFSVTPTAILGPYIENNDAYVTADGLFMATGAGSSGLGGARIFQQLPQGYQWGPNGVPEPLYEIALTIEDVAGQPINYVAGHDEAGANGLTLTLTSDATPMPAGAKVYRQTSKVLVPHLVIRTWSKVQPFASLEKAQAYYGGTIQTLGGYRYLPESGSYAYVEYNGAVYSGKVRNVGATHGCGNRPGFLNSRVTVHVQTTAQF
jgi:hypothetical protein